MYVQYFFFLLFIVIYPRRRTINSRKHKLKLGRDYASFLNYLTFADLFMFFLLLLLIFICLILFIICSLEIWREGEEKTLWTDTLCIRTDWICLVTICVDLLSMFVNLNIREPFLRYNSVRSRFKCLPRVTFFYSMTREHIRE